METMSERERLPNRRTAVTRDMTFWNQGWHVTVGYYQDLRPGEVFIAGEKAGSHLDSTCRDSAILMSLCLQYGAPLEVIAGALTRNPDGSPSSIAGAVADMMLHEQQTDPLTVPPASVETPEIPDDK